MKAGSVYEMLPKASAKVRVHPDAGDVEMLVNQGNSRQVMEKRLARRNTTVKTKDHYRRGSIVIEKLEKRLHEKGESATRKEKALLRSLVRAKESGFVSKQSLVGFSIMGLGENVTDNLRRFQPSARHQKGLSDENIFDSLHTAHDQLQPDAAPSLHGLVG